MKVDDLADFSFAELRDRLKARAEQSDDAGDIDIDDALRYLTTLASDSHTAESIEALLHLAGNFRYASQPAKSLAAASHAAPLAAALGLKVQLCGAYAFTGAALGDLGRFAEATTAQAAGWALTRELGDSKREIWAIGSFATLCVGMGQPEVAVRYFERARELAITHGLPDIEFLARISLAECAAQLREPAFGFRLLDEFWTAAPRTRLDKNLPAGAHEALARLYLLTGDTSAARVHAEEAARLASTAPIEKIRRSINGLLGLIDVLSGAVDYGLSAVDDALKFAKDVDCANVPAYLNTCIDAYEAAGHLDRALLYLRELADWKRESIELGVPLLQEDSLGKATRFRTGTELIDDAMLAKAHSLQTAVRNRIQRLLESAVNAELASGHDLYRTFRLAKLARVLGAVNGWDEPRIASLALGAQLCNIGMMAIPARVLQKPSALSDGERRILRDHTRYGAELLRNSKLRILEVASVIAEQHHERFDGNGYPHGLGGDAITEEARVVAVCDAFDAMTHRRPWRTTPLTIETAMSELEQGAGTQFDPRLVVAFVDFVRRDFRGQEELDAFLTEGADQIEYVQARARMEVFLSEAR